MEERERTPANKAESKAENAESQVEQQTRLEEAKTERIKAETKKDKQKSKEKNRQKRHNMWSKIRAKANWRKVIAAIAIVIVLANLLLYLLDDRETHPSSEATLKEAVNIENLSAIDYVYCGIAEKPGRFLWMDNVEYRIKYEAHVRAYYNMDEIQFSMDKDNKVATAYLPEPQFSEPKLDETKFGYLPEKANADIPDILAMCREDAANELNYEQMKGEAEESLKGIVQGLTLPLLDDGWQIEFKPLAEYEGGAADEAE